MLAGGAEDGRYGSTIWTSKFRSAQTDWVAARAFPRAFHAPLRWGAACGPLGLSSAAACAELDTDTLPHIAMGLVLRSSIVELLPSWIADGLAWH